ncbi:TOPRIM nucleotidyl transferase/hydrolase domain-containing protein [Streptomyces sp. NBC_00572]|uniref:TOPRIM nucleotidyl transferase/hydrolase domain-containing protein n=1 Tax=Streptomyces sp. NBC_00572 TaxID=2903664 RepID=UPI002259227E|nr:TOPRIM nucleotidyl transferase/hydrolase domain-containing protein [Streptomyces sp. NBC_00572]MCX4982393.1 ATP-dependent endonuclease [Streptomyces sp. NBC_00572]
MDATARFRQAVIEWAADSAQAPAAAAAARELAAGAELRTAVLVEGVSDEVALDALAARHGRSLAAEGIAVVPLGGATNIGRFVQLLGPRGLDVPLAGLCDAGEEGHFARALERAGLGHDLARADMEPLGFYVCVADLEEELIRSLGAESVQRVVDAQGDLRAFRIFQKQPAQRERNVERQLRRFMGTISGRKSQYARSLIDALALAEVPRPLDRLLAHVSVSAH